MYVSDALESVFDCSEIRQFTREKITDRLNKYDAVVQQELGPYVKYVSGKCMGYPSIWFLSELYCFSRETLSVAADESILALLFSLSTSITDDFIDADEQLDAQYMYTVYFLILEMIANDSASQQTKMKIFSACNLLYSALLKKANVSRGEKRVHEGGSASAPKLVLTDRIGIFYEMIAFEFLENINGKIAEKENVAISLTRKFGRFCCLLDDIIDLEKDVTSGEKNSYPYLLLKENNFSLHDAGGDKYIDLLVSATLNELDQISDDVKSFGANDFSEKLSVSKENLKKIIPEIRKKMSDQYLNANKQAECYA